jgi:AraC-like DNA-binding protein
VARYLVVFLKRPGGQAQFSEALSMQSAEDEFGALHEWINKHLSGDLSLAKLADQAGMSKRGFSRHYARDTHASDFVNGAKLEAPAPRPGFVFDCRHLAAASSRDRSRRSPPR